MTSCVAGVVMTMDVKAETQKNTSPQECAGCGKKITERWVAAPYYTCR